MTMSSTNLIDDIILSMKDDKIFDCLKEHIPDMRAHNTTIPYELIWASAITAKMKIQTSLSDIPFAIQDHRTLAKLGYTLLDTEGNLKRGLMREGSLRFLLDKYDSKSFVQGYNDTVQQGILPLLDIESNIHILDCTDIEVNLRNENYEGSGIGHSKRDDTPTRGYKLATLRGIVQDTGLIEDIRFGNINTHDLKLAEEMLKTSPMLKAGDILINDRGFISRDLMNFLKRERGVDTYIPLKTNMEAYDYIIYQAKGKDEWKSHPNKKRINQEIILVEEICSCWRSSEPEYDVPFNACVVHNKEDDQYAVFITTDTTKTAREIILTYELRPEIEEDYRQLKDFWQIEDFKSTKINVILFHIICVLFGYLFFQLYILKPEGMKYLGKSLPVILKSYMPVIQPYVVFYVDDEFGVLTLFDTLELYAQCSENIRQLFKKVLEGKK